MIAAIFQPTPLDWLFGGGIGTNIGASVFWAIAAGGVGYWLRGHIKRLHIHLDKLHRSHAELHRKLDALTPPTDSHPHGPDHPR